MTTLKSEGCAGSGLSDLCACCYGGLCRMHDKVFSSTINDISPPHVYVTFKGLSCLLVPLPSPWVRSGFKSLHCWFTADRTSCIWLQKIKQLAKTTQGSMIWVWTEVRLASNKWSEEGFKGKGMIITCRLSILTLLCCTVSLLLVKRGDGETQRNNRGWVK